MIQPPMRRQRGPEGFTLILRNLHWSHARLAILVILRDRIALGAVPGEPVLELESMRGEVKEAEFGSG